MNFQTTTDFHVVDLAVVLCANLFNLMMVAIFLLRAQGRQRAEHRLGLFEVPLAIVFAIASIINWMNARDVWLVLLPALVVLFIMAELLLDYILKIEFRHKRLLGPYLLFFYAAQMGMIGYAFIVKEVYGLITLLTYFASLAQPLIPTAKSATVAANS